MRIFFKAVDEWLRCVDDDAGVDDGAGDADDAGGGGDDDEDADGVGGVDGGAVSATIRCSASRRKKNRKIYIRAGLFLLGTCE